MPAARAVSTACGDRARGHDVVFLDQDPVEQPDAVVVAPADAHRILLRRAQARDGLAGIEQLASRAFDQLDIGMRGLAVPDNNCRKLSAVRSPVSNARAGPLTVNST